MNFRLSMDWLCWLVTIVVTVFFIIAFGVKIIPLYFTHPIESILLGLLISSVYAYCFTQRPLAYSISAKELRVSRLLKDFVIEYKAISDVRIIAQSEVKATIRKFGVGGLFGYFGIFSNAGIGKITVFASRMDRMVLIETKNGKSIMITPDQPHLFVNVLRSLKGK